jgi:hypothetical protein
MKQKSVENFGTASTTKQMRPLARKQRPKARTNVRQQTKGGSLRLYEPSANGALQVRLARRGRVRYSLGAKSEEKE